MNRAAIEVAPGPAPSMSNGPTPVAMDPPLTVAVSTHGGRDPVSNSPLTTWASAGAAPAAPSRERRCCFMVAPWLATRHPFSTIVPAPVKAFRAGRSAPGREPVQKAHEIGHVEGGRHRAPVAVGVGVLG